MRVIPKARPKKYKASRERAYRWQLFVEYMTEDDYIKMMDEAIAVQPLSE